MWIEQCLSLKEISPESKPEIILIPSKRSIVSHLPVVHRHNEDTEATALFIIPPAMLVICWEFWICIGIIDDSN